MVVFLAQISSLIFGNGDRLDKKSWLKSRDFKAWCISGENKPESSGTVLNYFHHMEILGHRKLKGIKSCLTWKWQRAIQSGMHLSFKLFKRAMVLSFSCVFGTPPPSPHLLPPSPHLLLPPPLTSFLVSNTDNYEANQDVFLLHFFH